MESGSRNSERPADGRSPSDRRDVEAVHREAAPAGPLRFPLRGPGRAAFADDRELTGAADGAREPR